MQNMAIKIREVMRKDSFLTIRKELQKEAKDELERESQKQISKTTSNFKTLLSRRIRHSQLKVSDAGQQSLHAPDSSPR